MERKDVYISFEISNILKKIVQEEPLTFSDHSTLETWLLKDEGNKIYFNNLKNENLVADSIKKLYNTDSNVQFKLIEQKIRKKRKLMLFRKMSIAAGFIVVFGTSIWYLNYKSGTQEPTFKTIENDILPGSNKATITFGNGKAINLKETEGILVTPSGLTYSDGSSINDSEFIGSAILKTPRGGQYKITLADGSKVWLNSNSSLEYPVKFSNNNREVRLNGEAYFEVHHDPKHPFLVNTTLQEVKVLGTTFNIRAYEDKQYTTLVQGSVEIKSNGSTFTRKLKPNEQAIIDHYSLSIKNVDALDFIGWKEGLINSGNISLVELSKEVERWYDVDFKFPQNFKNSESADLSINKNENLSTVLKVIDKTYGVKTEIHGKEVIIR
ncbi:FecR family protein [Chryseobacterium lactis]|uniref:FecR family protein n=3 Tax=Chryseobacterium TaxID=59732 RepID=A0A3G6RJB4_CHRLC|nr:MULTISPECIES: FecR family protein [Bacteroidota]AZA84517.1 FecR family protein [Chryseobacterium lactis]AZB04905.1 FecR family protein [Chryseobacterium lactis]KMQ64386.1 hypothetical protein ACM46_08870 [Chryseobacterium angstadtii]MBF6643680.1 FecR family protein [Chryseobacterium indologenes]PNW14636.1 FecR family protein [Chryseobacterium lactis]